MKKLVLLCMVGFAVLSCDLGDDTNMSFVVAPVKEVTMASKYKVDSTSQIMIKYTRPTDCHMFDGLYYLANDHTRTVAIQFAHMEKSNCQVDTIPVFEVPLNFRPVESGTYTFKFWDGQNTDGTDHFAEYEAIVP